VAGALGLALGAAALRFVSGFDFQDLPYGKEIGLDGTAALYALGLSSGSRACSGCCRS
jgi:hypothetical protein